MYKIQKSSQYKQFVSLEASIALPIPVSNDEKYYPEQTIQQRDG